jgi:ABC-type glutathione transport system ATPase component
VLLQQGRQRDRPPDVVSPLTLALTTCHRQLLPGQPLLQQCHPALAAGQAVFGRQAVAHHQQRALALRVQQRPRQAKAITQRLQCRSHRRLSRSSHAQPIITVQRLHKQVADATGVLTILHDIDFELAERESVAIVGASGSGKSTLLSILAGLDVPSRARSAGRHRPLQLDEDARAALRARQMGFVFQSFQLLGT